MPTKDHKNVSVVMAIDGRTVGQPFKTNTSYPSKAGLIRWFFENMNASLDEWKGSPVASLTTQVVGGAFASAGLSPTAPNLPTYLLNKQPFYIAGKAGSGRSSGNVSAPKSFLTGLMDSVVVSDSATYFYPSAVYKVSWTDSRVGTVLSKWKAVIRKGGNATTPMTAQRGVLAGTPGNMIVRFKRSYDKKVNSVSVAGFTSVAAPTAFSVAGLVEKLDTRALEKLHGKLYDLQHDARVGETIGEFRQALQMIGRPLDGMRRLIEVFEKRAVEAARNVARRVGRPLSRLDPRDVREINAALASLYLEFVFGWKPLAADLLAAINAVGKIRGSCATVVNASFTSDAVYSDQTVNDVFNSYCTFRTRTLKMVKCTVRYKVGINPDKVVLGNYAERLGITPREFIPTAYAILPYSWLFDYFTGMNVLIESLCADLSFTTWTCKTVRNECSTEITSNPDTARAAQQVGVGFIDATGSPAVARSTMVTSARSVPTSLIASPVLRVPQAAKPWANIAALFVQRKVGNAGFLAAQLLAAGQSPKT